MTTTPGARDPDHLNGERSEWAYRTLLAFKGYSGTVDEDCLMRDLLTDLMHYADESGQDFDEVLACARHHYLTESGQQQDDLCPSLP
jgi:hypothetical protein